MDEQNYNQPNWQPPEQDSSEPQGQPVYRQPIPFTKEMLPPQYRPLSAWAYFGYTILFNLPLAGIVFLIIFSFDDENINRRSFARSYWCVLLLGAVLVLSVVMFILIAAVSTGILGDLPYYY